MLSPMNAIPSIETLRAALEPLTMRGLEELAAKSGVPFTTLYKIKLGTTRDPGLETVRKFAAHLPEPANAPA